MRTAGAIVVVSALVGAPALPAGDVTPPSLLNDWRAEAGTGTSISTDRGRQLFQQKGSDWRCSTWHTADPRAAGKHVVTGKPILALAPSADPQRFTDRAKVDKWFRRNCRDVLGRPIPREVPVGRVRQHVIEVVQFTAGWNLEATEDIEHPTRRAAVAQAAA